MVCVLIRECVCEQFCEDESTMSSGSDNLCPQCVKFNFDVDSVNSPCSNVAKSIVASFVDSENMMRTLRRVRKDDNVCYAKTTTACLAHCEGTMFGMIKDGVEPIGLVPHRTLMHPNGCTTHHQDYREYEDELVVKLGLGGHFEMKRGSSRTNSSFLSLDCNNATCINTTEAFHLYPLNPYFHRGGGNDSLTITFGLLDGKPITKEQTIKLMHFLCSLDHQLESIGFDADRTLKDLFAALNVRKLKQWNTQDLQVDKIHFSFMIKCLVKLGADFLKKPVDEQINTFVFSPMKKRLKSVGSFLKVVQIKHWEHGQSAFEPDQLEVLRRIGLIAVESQSTQQSDVQFFFRTVATIKEYQEKNPSFDINDPSHFTPKSDLQNGKLVEQGSESVNGRETTGLYIHKLCTQIRHKTLEHWKVMVLNRNINLRAFHSMSFETIERYKRLHRYKMQGGDINALATNENVVENPDGTWVTTKNSGGHCGREGSDGGWLYLQINQRRNQKITEGQILFLAPLGIDWNRKYQTPGWVYPETEKNPNYIILKAYHESGRDVNQLTQCQSLRKSEDGTWECVPAKKGDMKPGKWLSNQRGERKRNRLSGDRTRALEAIEIDWRDGA